MLKVPLPLVGYCFRTDREMGRVRHIVAKWDQGYQPLPTSVEMTGIEPALHLESDIITRRMGSTIELHLGGGGHGA